MVLKGFLLSIFADFHIFLQLLFVGWIVGLVKFLGLYLSVVIFYCWLLGIGCEMRVDCQCCCPWLLSVPCD